MDAIRPLVEKLAQELAEEVISLRRTIHAYPEIAFDEFKTSELIQQKLSQWGIPYRANIATTGVVALIEGVPSSHGPVIALRADMDALPIAEESGKAYCSTRPGYMHACGHDAHTAMLLGTGKILNDLRNHFQGRVMLIFQPSEERHPGGARIMLKEGIFQTLKPDLIFGQHVLPELETGTVGLCPGKYMASTDEFYIRVMGQGGHGATPHLNIDPVVVASEIVLALQTLVSRRAHPAMPTVISVGKMVADGLANVIPDHVEMEGIIRTFDDAWRATLHDLLRETVSGIAQSHGATAEVTISKGYPALYNDPAVTERVQRYAQQYFGDSRVKTLPQRMTADDMAYFLKEVPGTYFRLGTGNREKGITANLHTARFDIDEEALQQGVAFMAYLVLSEMSHRQTPH
ncbi:MAG: N-acyl-L-amino acid amidohydrolase [Bacteroidetes bacterium]|nr:MAG: N-acyl-L-amino acid amidohydrolase [Bacteroidota bacterium]